MIRALIIGGTGRLGQAVEQRFKERGDEVFVRGRTISTLPEGIHYVVFCQRYKGQFPSVTNELIAAALMPSEVLKHLGFADTGDCAVVVVSSVMSIRAEMSQGVGYHMGKAAQLGLVNYYAGKGIRTNAVSPWGFTGETPKVQMREVVDVIDFLCSPKSSGVSGQNIVIDRGASVVLRA